MSEAPKPSLKERLFDAIIRKIEGNNDFKQKADLLVKTDKNTIKTMSDLSEQQVDAIATGQWVGKQFPSMKPLAELMLEFAAWSPSKKGERAKQLTATMISEHTSVIPMALQPNMQGNQTKKNKKENEKDGD
jgi:hypothetical protein